MRLQHAFAERSVEIPRAHLKRLKKRKERKGTRERSARVCVCVECVRGARVSPPSSHARTQ
jgi:hypothetical protein